MDILEKIDKLRKEKNWSVYKLAYEAGINQSTITNMFARKTLPSITTLEYICDALNITLSEFFNDGESVSVLSIDEQNLIISYRQLSKKEKTAVMNLCNNLKN